MSAPCQGDAFVPMPTAHGDGTCSTCTKAVQNGGKCGPIADPDNLPKNMRPGMLYRGKDGKWYDHDGLPVSRKQRRRAGIR